MNRILSVLLSLMLSLAVAQAQEKHSATDVKVDVTVVDVDGNPLPGATLKGSDRSMGVVADVDGKASLWVARGSTLSVTYLGMKSKFIKVKAPISGNITLENDDHTLKQVVVTGYTQTDIRKTTGSVSSITGKELNDSPVKGIDMLMQGKLAGVNVQAVSGRPGESAKVRVRGISSITGNNEPLWVVDGVPIQKNIPAQGSSYIKSGDFSTLYANGVAGINPQDIESITVLKDASAAAIYGSEAQAGVIVITTKRGKEGRLSINYQGSLSIQSRPIRDDNLMNSQEKLAYEQAIWDEFSASGYASGGYYPVVGIVGMIRSGYGKYAGWTKDQQDAYIAQLGQQSTDWFDTLLRTSTSTSHNISLSGGTDKQTFYVSGGMTTNNGIVKRTSSDSYNFSVKLNGTPTDKLSYGFDVDLSYLKSNSPSQSFNIFNYAYFANPYERLYNDDGTLAADETYFSLSPANNDIKSTLPENGLNVLRELNETTTKGSSTSTMLRGDITWRPFKGFRLYGLASATFSNDDSENIIGKNTYTAWQDRPFEGNHISSKRVYGSMTQAETQNISWLTRLQANYSTTFAKKHYVSAIAGTEIRWSRAKTVMSKVYGYDPVTGKHVTPTYWGSKDDGSMTESEVQQYRNTLDFMSTYDLVKNAFASFYGALDYSFDNRYVFNATVRSDGSNNFGSKEQFNLTWSTGLAWNIDEEKFFKPLKSIVNRATVRLSTGLTGGVNKNAYPQLIMTYGNYYRTSATDSYRIGYVNNAPNAKLRWEHTQDLNASIDLGFLNERVSLYASAYRRRGYDLVTSVNVVSTTGFSTQYFNTSEQINEGFEIAVNAVPLKLKDFKWSVSGNVAYNYNYVSKYESPNNSLFTSVTLNYPLGSIFGYKSTGINPTTGIYNYTLRPNVEVSQPSDMRNYKNYIYYLGTDNAPWNGGVSTNITYKRLTISANGAFSIGALKSYIVQSPVGYSGLTSKVYNTIFSQNNDLYSTHLNMPKDAARRWTVSNPVTDGYPRLIDAFAEYNGLELDQPNMNTQAKSQEYDDASFFKLSSVSLSYAVPDKWIRHIGISSMGVSFTANNLFMLTGFKGLNPETPGAVYPTSKSYSFGINIGL